jgi:hypothetical protein
LAKSWILIDRTVHVQEKECGHIERVYNLCK